MVTVLADNKRTARKSHPCSLCREAIEQGEQYRDVRCADAGEAWTWREHLRCQEFLAAIDYWIAGDYIDAAIFADLVCECRADAIRCGVPGAVREGDSDE